MDNDQCQKCVYISMVTSRAEIQFKCAVFLDTFNFSSDTRGHFLNVNTLLASLATWSKKRSRWSSNKVIGRNLQERSNFKAYVPGNLKGAIKVNSLCFYFAESIIDYLISSVMVPLISHFVQIRVESFLLDKDFSRERP